MNTGKTVTRFKSVFFYLFLFAGAAILAAISGNR